MIRRFYQETLAAVAALEKYLPNPIPPDALRDGGKIPTDLPPYRDETAGARYALTGGVYRGDWEQEYYLQLWLWDMADSTMIYTDDLVYEDMNEALASLPGLVEWLFSHIHEITAAPPPVELKPDPWFTLGFRLGVSPRWYVSPGEQSAGAQALCLEGGLSGSFRLSSLLALQLEAIFSGDTVVYRGLDLQNNQQYILANEKFSSFSLMLPLLLRMNFRPGPVRISPLAGLYVVFPLGDARYRMSTQGSDYDYPVSFSVPLGFTVGLEGGMQAGPGEFFMDLRYNGDFGTVTVEGPAKTEYKRHILSITLGYEFRIKDRNK
jgi:hypothetical protein